MAADRDMAQDTPERSGLCLPLHDVARLCGGELRGDDVPVFGVSIDSRTVAPGNLFVAIRGENFDGHDFARQALERGAAAAMIHQDVPGVLPALRVQDTRQALGRLAAGWRARFDLPLAGITGSNGKTTVKEMLAAILARRGPVLATRGNLNNDIGVPLTLLRLGGGHRFAVVEMGANHAGEIACLAELAQPCLGLVTNAGPAHLEGFGSVEGVARAKGELYAALPADGIAVINADDAFAGFWRGLAADRRVVTFGLEAGADVGGRWQAEDLHTRLVITLPGAEVETRLALPGRHNVMNALAAAAAAWALGAAPEDIAAGLAAVAPVPGRLRLLRGPAGMRILDDTYNANPGSLAAALEVMASLPGRHWLALGDMAELGGAADALHAEAGKLARARHVERLFAVGPRSGAAARAFGEGAEHLVNKAALAEAVAQAAAPDVVLLVKGSRAMHMEEVVERLREAAGAETTEEGTG